MCRMWGSNSGPLACQANTLPIDLPARLSEQKIRNIRMRTSSSSRRSNSSSSVFVAVVVVVAAKGGT